MTTLFNSKVRKSPLLCIYVSWDYFPSYTTSVFLLVCHVQVNVGSVHPNPSLHIPEPKFSFYVKTVFLLFTYWHSSPTSLFPVTEVIQLRLTHTVLPVTPLSIFPSILSQSFTEPVSVLISPSLVVSSFVFVNLLITFSDPVPTSELDPSPRHHIISVSPFIVVLPSGPPVWLFLKHSVRTFESINYLWERVT